MAENMLDVRHPRRGEQHIVSTTMANHHCCLWPRGLWQL